MPDFMVRVQFREESKRKYTHLKKRLLNIGFCKGITSKRGLQFVLPNGTYMINAEGTSMALLPVVQNVAFQIKENPLILISEIKERVAHGQVWSLFKICVEKYPSFGPGKGQSKFRSRPGYFFSPLKFFLYLVANFIEFLVSGIDRYLR